MAEKGTEPRVVGSRAGYMAKNVAPNNGVRVERLVTTEAGGVVAKSKPQAKSVNLETVVKVVNAAAGGLLVKSAKNLHIKQRSTRWYQDVQDRVSHALEGQAVARIEVVLHREDGTRVTIRPTENEMVTEAPDPVADRAIPEARLADAIARAEARGDNFKDSLETSNDMLSSAEVATKLGMTAEGVRQKRSRHEIIGLTFAKRGIRFPVWQFTSQGNILPGLRDLYAKLNNDDWRVFSFLDQSYDDLGGLRARDALARGKVSEVLNLADSISVGTFS